MHNRHRRFQVHNDNGKKVPPPSVQRTLRPQCIKTRKHEHVDVRPSDTCQKKMKKMFKNITPDTRPEGEHTDTDTHRVSIETPK